MRASRLFPAPEAVFPEDTHHLEPAALGEGREFADLALAALVNRRDPGLDGGALSQLNFFGRTVAKQLIWLERVLSKTDWSSTRTISEAKTPHSL